MNSFKKQLFKCVYFSLFVCFVFLLTGSSGDEIDIPKRHKRDSRLQMEPFMSDFPNYFGRLKVNYEI